jgi:hypothetical protein
MPSRGKPPKDPSIKTTTNNTTTNTNNSSSTSIKDDGSTTASTITSNKSYAVNFLTSYEQMIRQQDIEYEVTTQHLRNVFERVQYLGRPSSINNDSSAAPQSALQEQQGVQGMLTYNNIRRCLLRLGISWNRTLPATSYEDEEDGYSVVSGTSSSGSKQQHQRDIITTDAQLIMLLTSLVEAEECYRANKLLSNKNNNNNNGSEDSLDQTGSSSDKDFFGKFGIFFPEFIQCYQLIVSGMQSLQTLNNSNNDSGSGSNGGKDVVVDRVKERTLGLLRPFGPDADVYKDKVTGGDGTNNSNNNSNNNDGKGGDDEGGLLPSSKRTGLSAKAKKEVGGFDDNEIKSLIRNKDDQLAMIIQEHESEMDTLASNIEILQSKHVRMVKLMKLRRALLIIGTVILCGGLLTTIIVRENQRRVDVTRGIVSLRDEEERKANTKIITNLRQRKDDLEKKVGDTQGTMRYLVNRNKGIEATSKEIEEKIESVDLKYWIDITELQRCTAGKKELDEELNEISLKKDAMEEELGWCQSRSRSMEKELNTLEHASSSSDTQVGEEKDDGSIGGIMGADKALNLDMKYNKSIRHAVTVRQVYSAAAGLVISTMIHQLLPIAIKVFVPKPVQIVAETATKKRRFVPPWRKRNKRAELVVIDGIFGSSITFLVIRAIALFVFP